MGCLIERKRKILMASPHIVTPTAAGLHTFNTTIAAPLKECRVNFSPVQEGEGDPAPDNVRPISGWTGVNVAYRGQNLISKPPFEIKHLTSSSGSTFISASNRDAFVVEVPKGTIYYRATGNGKVSYIGLCDSLAAGQSFYNQSTMTNKNSATLDNTDGHKYVYFVGGNNYAQNNAANKEFALFYNQAPTGVFPEPLGGTVSADWSSSAGTVYGGYVDLVRGVVVREWNSYNMSDLSWGTTSYANVFGSQNIYSASKASGKITLCLENYKAVANASGAPSQDKTAFFNTNGAYPYVRVKDTNYTTADDFKASLTGRKMLYKLATPVTYSIDPVTLKTLRGLNNIWSDANGSIELSYWTH